MGAQWYITVDGVRYEITQSYESSATGGFAKTSSEQGFTIIPLTLEGYRSIPGTLDGADRAFRTFLSERFTGDSAGNPLADDCEVREVEDSFQRLYTGTARFRQETTNSENEVEFGVWPSSFSAAGGQTRMLRSYGTRSYSIDGAAPLMGNMIGWNGEDFDGVDVVTPAFSFEISRVTDEGFITSFGTYANWAAEYVGTVNAYNFMGFKPGNVLFNGVTSGALQKAPATATHGAYNYWTLSYSFTASPSGYVDVNGVSVFKRGWEYLWYLTEKSYDPETGLVVPSVRAAYVEQVYRATDFADLGLGYNF